MEKLNNEDIKRLLSETTVDIDLAAEWDTLEAAMDKTENKRRGLWWWLSALPLIALGLYLLVPAVETTQAESNTQVAQTTGTPSQIVTAQSDITAIFNSTGINDTTLTEGTDTSNSMAETTSTDKTLPTNSTLSTTKEYASNENNTKGKAAAIYTDPVLTKTEHIHEHNDPAIATLSISTQAPRSTGLATTVTSTIPASRMAQVIPTIAMINTLQSRLLGSDHNRPVSSPALIPILTTQQGMMGRYIYAESAISRTDISTTPAGSDMSYQHRLAAGYTALSKSEAAIGVGYHINDRLSASAGIYYRQHRSVYRGDITDQTTEPIPKDTATVLTNVNGGTIIKAGEVTQITTVTTTLQQYNYHHGLGLQLAARYRVLGPGYVGANVGWTPVLWQSGQMLSPDNTLQPLADLTNSASSLNAELELGWQSQISEHIGLDLGVRYQPRQSLITLADTRVKNRAIGANVRLVYKW